MPWGLKRLQQTHFVTFSCYHRRPLLSSAAAKRTFEVALEPVRRRFTLCVYGYVVMPEHVHLLLNFAGDMSVHLHSFATAQYAATPTKSGFSFAHCAILRVILALL